MAVAVHRHAEGLTSDLYERGMRRLKEIGADRSGQTVHVCYGDPNDLQMLSVFESREAWERFRPSLVTIMSEMGLDASSSTITVYELHNLLHTRELVQ
jgi:hypothetical protein